MKNERFKRLGILSCLAAVIFSVSAFGVGPKRAFFSANTASKSDVAAAPKKQTGQSDTVAQKACELIYQGQFDAAGKLIEAVPFQYGSDLHQLVKIVGEYRTLCQKRQAKQESEYQQALAELEKLRTAGSGTDVNDVNDANSVAYITKSLSIVARVNEFADEKQRKQLLADPLVEGVLQQAREKAAEFESNGKWFDAYVVCYNWLQVILPDNQEYSDHAEQLVEKAGIVASFQDSPCESRKERYAKVERQMFTRAIDALDWYYVSLIDYRRMATEAVRRCRVLADMAACSSVLREALGEHKATGEKQAKNNDKSDSESKMSGPQYEKKKAAWSASLSAVLDEVNKSPTGISKDKFKNVFEKVLELNSTTIEFPESILIAQFADAALSSLDPYTSMVWPQQQEEFETKMTNEFTGIGIEITKEKGMLKVASLLPDTPAYYTGLDAGDVIEAVNGIETRDMSLECAVRNIKGASGTPVRLTIRRPGEDKAREITITRAKITVPSIRGWQRTDGGSWLQMIDSENKIGYVRLTSFSAATAADFEKALKELEAQGLRGLVLDLRFNSGGLLESAVDVSDKFIEEGLIVKIQPRFIPTYSSAKKEGTHPNYPLVILINRFSASASEIVAGALHDKAHKRAFLVGERTVGKGLVQGITPYPGGGAQLRYTMAYYHLPSGQRVESQEAMKKQGRKDWGIGPDIEIELRSDELTGMLNVQKDNDVLAQAGTPRRQTSVEKHAIEETLSADPQLATGLLVVKTRLIEQQAKAVREKAA